MSKGVTAPCWLPSGQGVAYALCEVCNLQLTSGAQAQLHYNGRSHLRRLRQLQAGETLLQAPGTLTSVNLLIISVNTAGDLCPRKTGRCLDHLDPQQKKQMS